MDIQTYIKTVGKLYEEVGWSLEETKNGLILSAEHRKLILRFEVDKNCLKDIKEKMGFECVLFEKFVLEDEKRTVYDEYIVVFWENDLIFNVSFILGEKGYKMQVNKIVEKGYNERVLVNEMPLIKEKAEKIQSYLIERAKKDPKYRLHYVFLNKEKNEIY